MTVSEYVAEHGRAEADHFDDSVRDDDNRIQNRQ